MKGVQCYELFGGIALRNHAFNGILLVGNDALLASNDTPIVNDRILLVSYWKIYDS